VAFAVREGPIKRHRLSASRKLCAAVGHAGTDVGFGESACRRKFPPPFIGVLNAIAGLPRTCQWAGCAIPEVTETRLDFSIANKKRIRYTDKHG
jgi:hypothetical protein